MPLPAAKPLSQAKRPLITTCGCTNTEKAALKKATSKTIIKGKAPAKKLEKAPKSKAGYELYCGSCENQDSYACEIHDGFDHLKTLVKETTNDVHDLPAESASGSDINYIVERHPPVNMDRTTQFNKRLISSTPDPERFSGTIEETVESAQNAPTMMTDAEREIVRQHIDAELVKEAMVRNIHTKEQIIKLANPQKKQPARFSSASGGDGPAAKRRVVPSSAASQVHHNVRDMKQRVEGQVVPSTSSHSAEPSFQKKVNKTAARDNIFPTHSSACIESVLPTQVSNVNMGFMPHIKENIPPDFLSGTTLPVSRPLPVATNDCGSYHASTPACSPVRFTEKQQVPFQSSAQAISSGDPRVEGVSDSQWGKWGMTAGGKALQNLGQPRNSEINVSEHTNSKLLKSGPKSVTRTNLFTLDGHYINQEVVLPEVPEADATPRSQQPVPMGSPATPRAMEKRDHITSSAQFNTNNSSSCNTGQLNNNQNTCSISNFMTSLSQVEAARYAARATAQAKTTVTSDNKDSSDRDMQDMFVKLDPCNARPEYTCQGILELRSKIDELKQCTYAQGSSSVCLLVEQLVHIVDDLPQLQEDFSLEKFLKPYLMKIAQLKERNGQLNIVLRRREEDQKKDANAVHLAELLHLEMEKTKLMEQLKKKDDELLAVKRGKCKRCDDLVQQLQQFQLQLKQKDHEALVRDQEKRHHIAGQTQELERLCMRVQSLQSKLSTADQEKSILDVMLKQKELQLRGLQEQLGKMKQASSELLDHLGCSMESEQVLLQPCSKILKELTQTSIFSGPDYDIVASKGPSQLDTLGNLRQNRFPATDRNGAMQSVKKSAIDAANTDRPLSPQQIVPTRESISIPQAAQKEISDKKEPTAVKESHKMNTVTPYTLTVEALEAHNKNLSFEHSKGNHSSEGIKAEPAHMLQQYSSELEMVASACKGGGIGIARGKHHQIQLWSEKIVRQQETDCDQDSSCTSQVTARDISEMTSEQEIVSALSEVPLSILSEVMITYDGMPASHVESGSTCSLSQVPISIDSSESIKRTRSSSAAEEKTCHNILSASVSQYTTSSPASARKKNPATNLPYSTTSAVPVSTPPASSLRTNKEKVAQGKETKMMSAAQVLNQNSSISLTTTGSSSRLTQKEYFQGTELDLSMSTIPEFCATSTMTGISNSTIRSIDAAKFTEFTARMDTLDSKLTQAQEKLQQVRQQFS